MNAVLRDPLGWFAQAATDGQTMIRNAWATAGEGLGPQDCADGSSLTIAPLSPAPGVDALVISLPAPTAPTECFFIAVVRVDGVGPRYFVAERGVDGEGGVTRAYWAEWKNVSLGLVHLRGEDLPTITAEALVHAAAEEVRDNLRPPKDKPKPRRKSKLLPLLGGLGVLGAIIGYLVYLEQFRDVRIPAEEVSSVLLGPPTRRGTPFEINFTWNGSGYATNHVWLVVDEGLAEGGKFEVSGEIQCDSSPSQVFRADVPSAAAHNVVNGSNGQFSGWVWFQSEYHRHSAEAHKCKGVIAPKVGVWSKARVVVTQSRRPSDWIGN